MTNMSNNGVNYEDVPLKEFELSYTELNSMINQLGKDGKLQLEKDKEAVRNYFLENVNPNTMFFHDIEEKLNFLVRNDYYDKTLLDKYTPAFIKALFKQAYSHKFRFPTYFGALKFYTQYALKTFDGKRYLERFEDRVVMNALYLADGNEELASDILEEIISGRYQPATPTFLNAGKQQRGEMVSCFPAGTKIMTDKGLVNIEELNIDDKVLSHKGVFNKIEKVITNPNNEYLVAIKHYGHKDELISTPNHPVLVYTQRDVESLIDTDGADVENGFVWLEAQDVQEGDYVVFASLDEEHEQIGNNEELIYSIGKNLDNYSGLKGTGKNLKNSDFYKIVNGKFVYQVNNVRITNEKPDTVYNLEVEDSHTYTVNSAIVHNCFLGRTEDNMESISKTINNALQLSKRGGGVAFSLTNVREAGAPIKHIENASSGIIPVMKILEDSFSYANQLGARQGAGAVYLNVHHPDILHFLDTKRENADEKIRIKTLSLGVVIPDITFKLAQKNEDMYLFSPYDVQREYGKAFSDISVSDEYYNMLDNPRIRKTKINARKLFQTIAEIQFESGYPYILFEDTANNSNPIQGRINMSNLCSEILQVNEASTYKEDGSYDKIGKDISCNLGSLNIAQTFDSPDFEKTIEVAIRSLTSVSDLANISSVPSIEAGNKRSHAIGLGQMNLHGFLAREYIHYDSPEALDFANLYFYSVLYYALKASNKIAIERGETFDGFENSKYFTGEFFEQYIEKEETAELESTKKLLEKTSMKVPTIEDWKELAESIKTHGIYNQNLQAIPPTGSISYINNSTASIHPVTYNIEGRKEGKTGKAYYPQPYLSDETLPYYKNAYDIENSAIIDMYAVATKYVDQGSSLTLFYKPEIHTTRELNKMYIYAWRKGIKTLYYARVKPPVINGTEVETAEDYCVSCQL